MVAGSCSELFRQGANPSTFPGRLRKKIISSSTCFPEQDGVTLMTAGAVRSSPARPRPGLAGHSYPGPLGHAVVLIDLPIVSAHRCQDEGTACTDRDPGQEGEERPDQHRHAGGGLACNLVSVSGYMPLEKINVQIGKYYIYSRVLEI